MRWMRLQAAVVAGQREIRADVFGDQVVQRRLRIDNFAEKEIAAHPEAFAGNLDKGARDSDTLAQPDVDPKRSLQNR